MLLNKPGRWGLWVCLMLATAGVAQAQQEERDRMRRLCYELKDQGRYAEAAVLAERVLQIFERDTPEDLKNISVWINNVAYLKRQSGNYDNLIPIYNRAIEVSRQAFGEEHPETAAKYDNLASINWTLGNYAEAEKIFLRALEIREKTLGKDDATIGQNLNNLALVYSDTGRYAEAEKLLSRTVSIREKLKDREPLGVATPLENLAGIYVIEGRYAEAEPLYRRSLSIREANLRPGHPDIAYSLQRLAEMFAAQSRYAEAETYFKRTLEIREAALGKDHALCGATSAVWGGMYLDQGRPAEAEPLLRRALGIEQKNLGAEHAYIAKTMNNLARAYADQGRLAEADPLHRRALEMREKLLGKEHPDVALSLFSMARLRERQSRLDEAEKYVNQALVILEKAHLDPLDRYRCYEMRAKLYWKMKRQNGAVADLNKALTLAEEARVQAAGGDTGRAAMFSSFAGAYERMVAWQIEMGKPVEALNTIERSRARSLMDQLATANVDFLAGLPAEEADALRTRQSEAQTWLAELEKAAENIRDGKTDRNLSEVERTDKLARLERETQRAREELVNAGIAIRNASPAYRQMVGSNFQPASVADMQTELVGDSGVLLEYLLGDEAGYAVIVPAVGGKVRIEPLSITAEQAAVLKVEAGPLTSARMRGILADAQGTGVLQMLRSANQSKSLNDRLAVLWQVLIPENERKLLTSGKLEQWTIIPDAVLAAFPFETLVVEKGEDMKYVLDVAPPLTTAPSSTLLMNLNKVKVEGAKGVLSIGDVNYAGPAQSTGSRGSSSGSRGSSNAFRPGGAGARYSSARGKLQPLPYTATESKWVIDSFKQEGFTAGSLLKDNARENSVRTFGPNYEILHLACHGLVDQGNGNLFGALALTPGPSGAAIPSDDGYLTLQEIYGMNLHGTRLAILSACDTNYGPQQRGEGVWSLSRGFIVAGAQRVVASNWLVDDEAAATLITAFCVGVAKGQKAGDVNYAQALHKAKRYIREQEKWQSPYYWGTFVLVGPAK